VINRYFFLKFLTIMILERIQERVEGGLGDVVEFGNLSLMVS
jgi:hypothetical protein